MARDKERRDALTLSVGESKGEKPTWNARCKWEDNIKMGLKEVI